MKIVKKIARWVLREEFEHYQNVNNDLRRNLSEATSEIYRLRERLFGTRKVLLSQTMLQCIVQMLPDPNRAGCGGLTASDLKMRNMCFVDTLGGRQYKHNIRFVQVIGEEKQLQGLTINISDYNINVSIPLRRENVSYEVFGVQTTIDTYFWDFYGAGIRMLSDEAFAMSSEFINAQHNVMKEFIEQGLL